jgi:hypothetical protein
MLRLVALVRTDVSEELSASFIRVTRLGELGTMLAVTSSPVFVTLMMEAMSFQKRRFLQERNGVTSQKTAVFRITAVITSDLMLFTGSFK